MGVIDETDTKGMSRALRQIRQDFPPGTSEKYLYRNCSYGRLQAMTHILNNDTPALNALKALRGAPTSMGRGEIPVELQPAAIHLPVSFFS